jgi:heme/copper-type cytochrome/quinol oxidase subunit 4
MSESEQPVNLKSYIRLCAVVFLVVVCTTGMMIATSFAHIGDGWTIKVALILAIAVVNAFLVAGYLMHLLSEKKLVYAVLLFTVCFVVGLVGLTMWAMHDFPPGTAIH